MFNILKGNTTRNTAEPSLTDNKCKVTPPGDNRWGGGGGISRIISLLESRRAYIQGGGEGGLQRGILRHSLAIWSSIALTDSNGTVLF